MYKRGRASRPKYKSPVVDKLREERVTHPPLLPTAKEVRNIQEKSREDVRRGWGYEGADLQAPRVAVPTSMFQGIKSIKEAKKRLPSRYRGKDVARLITELDPGSGGNEVDFKKSVPEALAVHEYARQQNVSIDNVRRPKEGEDDTADFIMNGRKVDPFLSPQYKPGDSDIRKQNQRDKWVTGTYHKHTSLKGGNTTGIWNQTHTSPDEVMSLKGTRDKLVSVGKLAEVVVPLEDEFVNDKVTGWRKNEIRNRRRK
jgi:hypothetical protein